MQLVRITHRRCGDYDCANFALAPDDWSQDRIDSEVTAAQKAYLVEFDKANIKEAAPPYPGHRPLYEKYPDRTVAVVKAAHDELLIAYQAWQADRRKTELKFESFLTDRGFVSLWSDAAAALEAECDWGHRHGDRLAYGSEGIDGLPSPAKLAGGVDYVEDDFS